MTLYLIRHGKTLANEKHLYCGSTDLPLSDAGRYALSQLHYQIPSDYRYISSGMCRANETLEILFPNISYECISDFREVDFGQFEMHSYEDLKDSPAYQEWISGNNEANVPPNGESGVQMSQRALAAFQQVLKDGQDTVIVSHGGIIAALMAQLFPEEQKNRFQWQPKPFGGYLLIWEDGNVTYEMIP